MRRSYLLTFLASYLLTFPPLPAIAEITTTTDSISYTCKGTTVDFDFDWPIFTSAEIRVVLRTIADGTETVLTETTHYRVSADNDDYFASPGGTVTTVNTYSSDYELHILRVPDLTQEASYKDTVYLNRQNLEDSLDKLTMQVQFLYRLLGRAFLVPQTDPNDWLPLPDVTARKSKYLAFDAAGAPTIAEAPVITGTWDPNVALTAQWQRIVTGAETNADRLGAKRALHSSYLYDSNDYASLAAAVSTIEVTPATLVVSTAETLTASVITPGTLGLLIIPGGSITKASTYKLTIGGAFDAPPDTVFIGFDPCDVTTTSGSVNAADPRWWGAKGDRNTDCANAFQCAVQFFHRVTNLYGSEHDNGKVIVPAGMFRIDSPIDIPTRVVITVEGTPGSSFLDVNGCNGFTLKGQGYFGAVFRDFCMFGDNTAGKAAFDLTPTVYSEVAGGINWEGVSISNFAIDFNVPNTQICTWRDCIFQHLYSGGSVFYSETHGSFGQSNANRVIDCHIMGPNTIIVDCNWHESTVLPGWYSGFNDWVFRDCDIQNSGTQIPFPNWKGSKLVIESCEFENSDANALIELSADATSVAIYVTIRDNTMVWNSDGTVYPKILIKDEALGQKPGWIQISNNSGGSATDILAEITSTTFNPITIVGNRGYVKNTNGHNVWDQQNDSFGGPHVGSANNIFWTMNASNQQCLGIGEPNNVYRLNVVGDVNATGIRINGVPISSGGNDNLTEFLDQTAWRVFYSDGAGDVKELALGSDGEYLKSNGASAAPTWSTSTGGAHDAVSLTGLAADFLTLATQSIDVNQAGTLASNPALSANQIIFGSTGILFEGATADIHETLFTVTDPTADRTITMPNASGTLAVSATSPITLSAAGDIGAGATLTSLAGLTETNGGIAYGTADNAYAWLAAGAAGKVLQGAGAAPPAWSTPTYPSASGTDRKILVSDGTNNVYSTETWAVPGTAGKTLYSNGTNWVTLAAGATTEILVGGGTAAPVWTTATGTGAPVRAGGPTLTGQISSAYGNKTVPTYTFTGATNYGFYLSNGTDPSITRNGVRQWGATGAVTYLEPLALVVGPNTVADSSAVTATIQAPASSGANNAGGVLALSGGTPGAGGVYGGMTLQPSGGPVDAGSALTFEIPNGANPTVSAAGQVSVDTSATSGAMMRFYGDAAYALPAYKSKSFVIGSPADTHDFPLWRVPYAITIRAIHVLCIGGTLVTGGLDEADGNGANAAAIDADITSNAGTSASDDGSLTNPTVDAGDYLNWHTTTSTGSPASATVTFEYTVNSVN